MRNDLRNRFEEDDGTAVSSVFLKIDVSSWKRMLGRSFGRIGISEARVVAGEEADAAWCKRTCSSGLKRVWFESESRMFSPGESTKLVIGGYSPLACV